LKILFYSPFSGVWEFSAPEARLASALKSQGHEIVYVTCGGLLRTHCVVMSAFGIQPSAAERERSAVCRTCCSRARALRRAFGLRGPELANVISPDLVAEIEQVAEAACVAKTIETVWDGMPVGRRALYPFLIHKKRDTLDLSEQEWQEYRDQLRQTMLSVTAARQLLAYHKPDAVVACTSTYSVMSMFLEAARNAGVATFMAEPSPNLAQRDTRSIFARDGIENYYSSLLKLWPSVSDKPASSNFMNAVTSHLLHLFGGESVFVYSPSVNPAGLSVREKFGVPDGSRLLVATMSSYDEIFCAQQAGISPVHPAVFSSQIEWIDWLRDFMSSRSDLFLVIRVHPREFPTRRERQGITSSHARRLQDHLADLPPNCVVNWPSDNLSLYDFAKEADVILNAWSSAGMEMGLLGLPVVEWAPKLLLYPGQSDFCATDQDDYRAKIELALDRGWSADTMRAMYRWCALQYGAATFEATSPAWLRPEGRLGRSLHSSRNPLRRVNPDLFDAYMARVGTVDAAAIERVIETRAPTLAHANSVAGAGTVMEESAVLARELDRIVAILFRGDDLFSSRLHRNLVGFINQQAQAFEHNAR
jgi:hypothetical protein